MGVRYLYRIVVLRPQEPCGSGLRCPSFLPSYQNPTSTRISVDPRSRVFVKCGAEKRTCIMSWYTLLRFCELFNSYARPAKRSIHLISSSVVPISTTPFSSRPFQIISKLDNGPMDLMWTHLSSRQLGAWARMRGEQHDVSGAKSRYR